MLSRNIFARETLSCLKQGTRLVNSVTNPVLMWPPAPAEQLHLDVGNAQLPS